MFAAKKFLVASNANQEPNYTTHTSYQYNLLVWTDKMISTKKKRLYIIVFVILYLCVHLVTYVCVDDCF
ncbi:hypothetical protein AtNW77_Chr1g0062201 [Arabidopsis thaliana]